MKVELFKGCGAQVQVKFLLSANKNYTVLLFAIPKNLLCNSSTCGITSS